LREDKVDKKERPGRQGKLRRRKKQKKDLENTTRVGGEKKEECCWGYQAQA